MCLSGTRRTRLHLCVLITIATALGPAVSILAQDRSYGTRRGYTADPRMQQRAGGLDQRQAQLQQQYTQIGETIDGWLVALLERVNESKRPDDAFLASAEKVVQSSTAIMSHFDAALQCEHALLNAWVSYFKGDIETAYMTGNAALAKDQSNHDAYVSHVAFALAANRPPRIHPPQQTQPAAVRDTERMSARRRPTPPSRMRRPEQSGRQSSGRVIVNTQSGNILQYDPEGLAVQLLGRDLPQVAWPCANGAVISYQPGTEGLCMLVWKSPQSAGPSQPGEPNSVPRAAPGRTMPTPPGARPQGQPALPGLPALPPPPGAAPTNRRSEYGTERRLPPDAYESGYRRGPAQGRAGGYGRPMGYEAGRMEPQAHQATVKPQAGLQGARKAFSDLFATYIGRSGVKFLGLNLDGPERRAAVLADLVANPRSWPEVTAADIPGGPDAIQTLLAGPGVDLSRPMLVIADAQGKIRYAGPPQGFVPRFLLEHLAASGAIAVGAPAATGAGMAATPTGPTANPFAALLRSVMGARTPGTRGTMPPGTRQTVPPAQGQTQPQGQSQTEQTETERLLEQPDLIQAQKELEYAKGLFIPLSRKRMLTSKKGVDACRDIIKRWPGTKYAEEARNLLRQLPEADRRRYNITNDELGL